MLGNRWSQRESGWPWIVAHYAAAWRAKQQATTIDPPPSPAPAQQGAQEEDSPAVPASPACPGAPRSVPWKPDRALYPLGGPRTLPPPVHFCSRHESGFLYKEEP